MSHKLGEFLMKFTYVSIHFIKVNYSFVLESYHTYEENVRGKNLFVENRF